jgi:hypothetical protein
MVANVLEVDLSKHRPEELEYPTEQARVAGRNTFPAEGEGFVKGPVLVQLVDIMDISKSKYNILRSLEDDTVEPDPEEEVTNTTGAATNGNASRGGRRRRIAEARTDEEEGGEDAGANASSSVTSKPKATFRVVFQDKNGKLMFGLEVFKNPEFNMDLPLGSKWILNDTNLRRDVLILKGSSLTYLGGGIPEMERGRREKLILRLKDQLGIEN